MHTDTLLTCTGFPSVPHVGFFQMKKSKEDLMVCRLCVSSTVCSVCWCRATTTFSYNASVPVPVLTNLLYPTSEPLHPLFPMHRTLSQDLLLADSSCASSFNSNIPLSQRLFLPYSHPPVVLSSSSHFPSLPLVHNQMISFIYMSVFSLSFWDEFSRIMILSVRPRGPPSTSWA